MSVLARTSSEKPLVDVRRLTHVYRTGGDELIALRELNLQLAEGETLAIVGPSGSGKTTLLNILAGLEVPTPDTVWVDGRDLARMSDEERDEYRRRHTGYAWQRAEKAVWQQLSVSENVMLPMLGVLAAESARRERAAALVEAVGLHRYVRSRPAELGYGERRRLALAVALANHPRLLLADEVTAGLDEDAADQLLASLRRLLGELGAAALVVAHGRHLPRHVDRIVPLPYARAVPPPHRPGRNLPQPPGSQPSVNGRPRPDVLVAESISRRLPSSEGSVEVLRDVSLWVGESEMVSVLGGSGAGKSVLLALCSGLDEPDAGTVTVAGQEMKGLRRREREAVLQRTIGWVVDARPPLHVTPRESLRLAARIGGAPPDEASRLAEVALAATGLQERAETPVGRLSGGEQARLAVARALARAPALIVADEPTAQLDILASMDVIGLLREAADSGIAVLLATHSPVLADVADRVLALQEGRLSEVRRR